MVVEKVVASSLFRQCECNHLLRFLMKYVLHYSMNSKSLIAESRIETEMNTRFLSEKKCWCRF